jgi:RNA polymerase sigma-70 factor (ECF subfamily)
MSTRHAWTRAPLYGIGTLLESPVFAGACGRDIIRNVLVSLFTLLIMSDTGEVTRLLGEISGGKKDAMNQLLPLVYDELHRLARSYFRRERGEHTLQPTALVHEAYIRMVDQKAAMQTRGHFLAVAATQMRRILLDYARKHKAERRGGGGQKVLLEDTMAIAEQRPLDMIGLDSALTQLGMLDAEQARLVELRFFGGLSVEETAEVMGVSPATIKRSWSSARAFLHREMTGGTSDAGAMGADPADL